VGDIGEVKRTQKESSFPSDGINAGGKLSILDFLAD
jgi:hypothetical protein